MGDAQYRLDYLENVLEGPHRLYRAKTPNGSKISKTHSSRVQWTSLNRGKGIATSVAMATLARLK